MSWLIVLQGLLFAAIDVFTKIALLKVPVFVFVCVRMGLTSCLLLLLFGRTIIRDLKTVSPRHYILPAACLSISILMSNLAVHLTAATSFAFIRSLTAVIAPLLMTLFFNRKYTIRDAVIQSVLVAGLYLLCAKGGLTQFGIGEVLAFLCAVLAAVSLVFGADALNYVDPYTLTFFQMAGSCVLSFMIALIDGSFATAWYAGFADPQVVTILMYNVLIGSMVGYIIQNKVLKKVSPKTVGITQCAYPVFTALIANFFLGEMLSAQGFAGAFIIIACIIAQAFNQSENN